MVPNLLSLFGKIPCWQIWRDIPFEQIWYHWNLEMILAIPINLYKSGEELAWTLSVILEWKIHGDDFVSLQTWGCLKFRNPARWRFQIPSLKLTWPLKIDPWKRRFLLETIVFRGYVSFREGSFIFTPTWGRWSKLTTVKIIQLRWNHHL